MENHGVTRLLRELPRETARPGFTDRVLASLDDPAELAAPLVGGRFGLAAAALLLVCLLGGAGAVHYAQSRETAQAAQARKLLREIRAEHDRIERELHSLTEPRVIYLGGDERLDLVVDLDRIQAEDGLAPATFRVDTF